MSSAEEIKYIYSDNPVELLGSRDISHLAGRYLTAERLANSAFAIAADKGDFTGGIIIGELPWGPIGESWDRHVPNAVELGALFVDPSLRATPAAFRLMNLAVSAAARIGRTPVAVTEVGSPVYRYLARVGATPRAEFTEADVTYVPWVLVPGQPRHLQTAA
jgi:GNAT superfamily N-acetyltransferase